MGARKQQFKVWVQIEQITNSEKVNELIENVGEPVEIGCFDTLEEAEEAVRCVETLGETLKKARS